MNRTSTAKASFDLLVFTLLLAAHGVYGQDTAFIIANPSGGSRFFRLIAAP